MIERDRPEAAKRRETEEIVRETLINLERVEDELSRVKRRLLEHLEFAGGSDL